MSKKSEKKKSQHAKVVLKNRTFNGMTLEKVRSVHCDRYHPPTIQPCQRKATKRYAMLPRYSTLYILVIPCRSIVLYSYLAHTLTQAH